MQNRTLNNQTEVKSATPANAVIRGRYGIISLFDGVSSVVPILRKKLGYPPVAVILAECDLSLRHLVCTEFTYRSDFFFLLHSRTSDKALSVIEVKTARRIRDSKYLQNRKQKHHKATNTPKPKTQHNTKQKTGKCLECETRGEKRVKRPKRPNALICRTPGGSMRYPLSSSLGIMLISHSIVSIPASPSWFAI